MECVVCESSGMRVEGKDEKVEKEDNEGRGKCVSDVTMETI